MKTNRRIISNILLFLLSLVLGILIAWQMKNLNFMDNVNLFGASDELALQEEIQRLQVANAELSVRNEGLSANIQELTELGSDDDARLEFYRDEIDRVSTYAGLTDVKGPGAIITLNTSEEGSYVDAASLLVIVNGLKANGAYAISVNGQRVVALTEISATGSGENSNIVMNGTNLTSSEGYEIRIIGEVRKLQDFYAFQNNIWLNLQNKGVNVQIHYPNEVEISALNEDSPAYRQNLLEIVEDAPIATDDNNE